MKRKAKDIKKDKIKLVDIKQFRFSPELEIELPKKEDSQALIERGKTLKGWEIKSDMTLDNGIELSPENSNHLYWNQESLMQIKEVLAIVRVHKGFINKKTCGLHIHVSTKGLSDKDVLKIINEWVHRQRYIVERFKINKDRLEDTCKLLPKEEINKLTEKQIHQFRNSDNYYLRTYGYIDEKYYSLNVNHLPKHDYQTIEFRLFSGSVCYRDIKSVIYFVLNFIKDALERD